MSILIQLLLFILISINSIELESSTNNNSYKLPICLGMLTYRDDEALNRTLKSLVNNNFFNIVSQSIIFFQKVDTIERQEHAKQVLLQYPYFNNNYIIEKANIYFESFIKIAQFCTQEYILILEEDFMSCVNTSKVMTQMTLATNMLSSKQVDLFWLRNRMFMGYPDYMYLAFLKYGTVAYDKLHTSYRIGYLSWNHSAELYYPNFNICHIQPKTICTQSKYAFFVNSPTLYTTSNLLKWLHAIPTDKLKKIHKFEWAMTLVIQSYNYTIAWSDGIYTHISNKHIKKNNKRADVVQCISDTERLYSSRVSDVKYIS